MSFEKDQPKRTFALGQESLVLGEGHFTLVNLQRDEATAVYRGGDTFVRIGRPDKMVPNFNLHKKMESAGFPVPRLIDSGNYGELFYFTEKSLGDRHLGDEFAVDVEATGEISEEHFNQLVSLVKKFALAQYGTAKAEDVESLRNGIHLELLCKEMLEDDAVKLQAKFKEVTERLSVFPYVITHGDFNPHNIYECGVIDFEDSFYGPFGYDLTTALVHIRNFPLEDTDEFRALYNFTPEQIERFTDALDAISTDLGLPPLSLYTDDLDFLRTIWSAVRMAKYPNLQEFRFNRLRSDFLS